MTHQVKVLDYAKVDYRVIKKWVRMKFGETTWIEVEADFKKVLRQIGDMPHSGLIPPEIAELGLTDYRQTLVGQTRVIYQLKEQTVYVHMFVNTSRDFSTMLNQRLLQPS
jgi:toxin ParE1/3/4